MTDVGARDSLAALVRIRVAGAGFAVALACVLCVPLAAAQTGSGTDPVLAARALGYEGIGAYQAGDHVLASQKLNRAYQLLPVPSLGLWSARALAKLNFLVEAAQRYDEVSRSTLLAGDADVHRRAQAEAARELAELLPRIPSVSLQLRNAAWSEVSVSVDGREISGAARQAPIPVNPGERLIEAQRGEQRATVRVNAVEKLRSTAVLNFSTINFPTASSPAGNSPAATPPASGLQGGAALAQWPDASSTASTVNDAGSRAMWRTVGWVGIGVGGSALVLSGAAGLVAWAQLDEFNCRRDPCTSGDPDRVETYNALVTASTVGYISGALIAGAGALLLYRYGARDADLELAVGAGSLALGGRF
jgi:hypothetical protein